MRPRIHFFQRYRILILSLYVVAMALTFREDIRRSLGLAALAFGILSSCRSPISSSGASLSRGHGEIDPPAQKFHGHLESSSSRKARPAKGTVRNGVASALHDRPRPPQAISIPMNIFLP